MRSYKASPHSSEIKSSPGLFTKIFFFHARSQLQLNNELPSPSLRRQKPSLGEQVGPILGEGFLVLGFYELDDSVEEREAELVEEGAGLKNGGSVSSSRSVEEEMDGDFSSTSLLRKKRDRG